MRNLAGAHAPVEGDPGGFPGFRGAPGNVASSCPNDPAVPTEVSSPLKSRLPSADVARDANSDGGDQTVALVLSGTALLVALGSAGYAGRKGHRTAHPGH
jgi:hypothetical protein